MVVGTVKALLTKYGCELKPGKRLHKGPLTYGYKKEVGVSEECNREHVSTFQQVIGILRWVVELGLIDIQVEVTLLPQYQVLP